MYIVEVKNLRIFYAKSLVVNDVSFALKKGETLTIIGPNGSGKTTLFRALINAIPYEGKIKMGNGVTVGYVPQKIDLKRDLPVTVREFLLLHKFYRHQYKEINDPAKDTLALVNLPMHFLDKRIGNLSAGELQRVLIAFALIGKPSLLLFDEPTSSVDIAGQETVYDLLHNLQQNNNFAMILISHDLSVVYRYADMVLCLNHSQVCLGPPKEVLTPESLTALYGVDKKFYTHSL